MESAQKTSIARSIDGELGLNYLFSGWLSFFAHIDPILSTLIERNEYALER